MKQIPLHVVLMLVFCYNAFGQSFQRIENLVGFADLAENNGAAVADYDGDLDLDIFIVAKAKDNDLNPLSQSKLFRNNSNGTFTDVTEASGLINLLLPFESNFDGADSDGFKNGVSWGDYDNDGFPDLFFTHSLKVQLFHNEGDGTFVEVTESAGITRANDCLNTGSTWFDVNNDGFLDIYLMDWGRCNSNILYVNNQDGTFSDGTAQYFETITSTPSFMGIPFDFNEDGFMDMYVSQDLREPNELFLNNAGTSFTDNASNFGLDYRKDDMGMAIGDFNNDGLFDIYIATIRENPLFINKGDGTFEDVALGNAVVNTGWAWGPIFADFDLDGDEDLFVTNGFKLDVPIRQRNFYLENFYGQGVNTFADNSNNLGFTDEATSVTPVPFDFDNDGDLDLFVTNSDKASHLYENLAINHDSANTKNWFQVALQGTVSNRDAIGAIVSVTTENGTLYRYKTGLAFFSQSLAPLHFGLNEASEITEVNIKWPSGLQESYNNFNSNTSILFVEGNGFSEYAIPEVVRISGCTDPSSCNYNPQATIADASCEYLPSGTISGEQQPSSLSTTVYSYSGGDSQSQYEWTVEGGEIIAGHGTNTITIKWGLTDKGNVSVKEVNDVCASLTNELEINLSVPSSSTEYSVARLWNEALLSAIRNDFARPTVHARNLFHTSIALYDSWAIYDEDATTYLMGNSVHGFTSNFSLQDFSPNEPIESARAKTISYAAYRLLSHRFAASPGAEQSLPLFDYLMSEMGYDINMESLTFTNGDAAALGNFIARTIINYGNSDGAREQTGYDNAFYAPENQPLFPTRPANPNLTNANRWQPLSLNEFIDQSGNLVPGSTPDFLSPEWGSVKPFSLNNDYKTSHEREGNTYYVFHDPSSPPHLNLDMNDNASDYYKWGFSMVSIWGAHLDPSDGVLWDISPKSIGNISLAQLPTDFQEYPSFYKLLEGGDIGNGHNLNPYTNSPYEEQLVPRGDYTRVLAEFWADGPDSETPPGHWFTLLNYVSDHDLLEKRLEGQGDILDALEWDVKSYFLMGGAMHDAAISAWSIKGWYDYIRPISAIRYMADLGQSSDASKPNYHMAGIPLEDGFIEIVEPGDPLEGRQGEHIGKIKVFTWRGHDYIGDTEIDNAGVDWILAENWWPYQRPSFVTPPFAGYVSGHSTYSRAAAEIMTRLTGDLYFPGGVGEFIARKNEFLVFEEGPSVDVILQWATYRDASDQCSLSRIWGGIHPPADDIPGRLIGEKIGNAAFEFGVPYFSGKKITEEPNQNDDLVYPNPLKSGELLYVSNTSVNDSFELIDLKGSIIKILEKNYQENSGITTLVLPENLPVGVYVLKRNGKNSLIVKQ